MFDSTKSRTALDFFSMDEDDNLLADELEDELAQELDDDPPRQSRESVLGPKVLRSRIYFPYFFCLVLS